MSREINAEDMARIAAMVTAGYIETLKAVRKEFGGDNCMGEATMIFSDVVNRAWLGWFAMAHNETVSAAISRFQDFCTEVTFERFAENPPKGTKTEAEAEAKVAAADAKVVAALAKSMGVKPENIISANNIEEAVEKFTALVEAKGATKQ